MHLVRNNFMTHENQFGTGKIFRNKLNIIIRIKYEKRKKIKIHSFKILKNVVKLTYRVYEIFNAIQISFSSYSSGN